MKLIHTSIIGLLLSTSTSCISPEESVDKEHVVEYFKNTHGDTLGVKTSKKLYGFTSKDGKVIIEPQYDYISEFENGIAYIAIGQSISGEGCGYDKFEGKIGLIDSAGKVLFHPQFDEVELEEKKIGVYRKNRKYGFFKTNGTFLTDTLFDGAELFSQNLASVMIRDKYGFMDTTGQLAIPNKFDLAYSFDENQVAVIAINEKYGIIGAKGRYVVPPSFDEIEPFKQDIAFFKEKGLYGVINSKGEIVQKAIFKDKVYVTDNYDRVCNRQDNWGLIDEKGRMVIEMKYDKIGANPERTKITLWKNNKETTLEMKADRIADLE